ncbi:hypothetical protein PFISCL1PPCAC_3768, partial [Pristionchus fissidentatus]
LQCTVEFLSTHCYTGAVHRLIIDEDAYASIPDDTDVQAPENLRVFCQQMYGHFLANRLQFAQQMGEHIVIMPFPASPPIVLVPLTGESFNDYIRVALEREKNEAHLTREIFRQRWTELTQEITSAARNNKNAQGKGKSIEISYINLLRRELTSLQPVRNSMTVSKRRIP